ncbi:response regulator [Hyphococcus luteus]|nr:response regulator [Marinicaulis flavus]
MRITQKVSLALGAAFIALCALLWAALHASVAPKFAAFEFEKASDNFERAQNVITRELQQLEAYRRDYGVWDDAYDYVRGANPDFIEDELPLSLLEELSLNIYLYMSADGSLIDGVAIDEGMETEVGIDAYAPSRFGGWKGLRAELSPDAVNQTILQTSAGPMLVAYAPVTRTDGGGAYVGHLLTGRILDAAFLDALSRQTRVTIDIASLDDANPAAAHAEKSVTRTDGFITIAEPIIGADGAPVAMLTAKTPREITAIGERTLLSAFAWLAAMVLLFIGIVSAVLTRIAVRPVQRLTQIISSASAETSERDDDLAARQDEIGILYNSFTNLIGRVEKHTSELASALNAAEAAERAKTQFLANMSHEIRTPMNGVMGMADLLNNTKLTETQKTFVDVIVKSSDALLTIINDILDFSKLDAGMASLHSAPFRLADIVEDVSTLIAARAQEKDVEIAVRIDPSLPPAFRGDAGRLRQILINLAGNAVKFTDKGYVLVDVSPVSEPCEERVALKFSVKDTGIGIPENKRTEIFEKFNQADVSSTRTYEGTGLGLAIAKALVELMGGDIGVDSTPGLGSVFWFTVALPVNEQPLEDGDSAPEAVDAKILIVDDNEVNRRILEEQAAAWGFPCVACDSGAAALRLLAQAGAAGDPYDVVIMDYHMPGMNGAQTVQRIRAETAIAATPVILLTSVDQADAGERFAALGIDAHLTKPARSGALLRTIAEVVHKAPYTPAKPTAAGDEPVSPAPPEETDCAAPPAPADEIDVLVAEDNEVNRLVISHILKSEGFSFEMAANGREAVEGFQRFKPKVILMDVSMPEMNGYEATAAIRALETESSQRTPIIGVTAHAVKGDMDQCMESGMDDYMSKPVTPKILSKKISQHIKDDAARGAA